MNDAVVNCRSVCQIFPARLSFAFGNGDPVEGRRSYSDRNAYNR